MTITRQRYRIPSKIPYQVTTLLAELGLNYYRNKEGGRRDSFWLREEANLHFILADVRKRFRVLSKRWHPDRKDGSKKVFAYLNSVFQRVVKLFKQKGVLCE